MIQDFQEVPAGFNYTIEAQVFNERVSSDLPVVTGTSDVFSVSAGESTEVVIIADPYQPTVLDTDGQIEAFSLAEAPYVFNDPADEGDITFTDLGGERWFGLGVDVVADLYARVVVDPGGNADAVLLQFEAGAIPDEGLDPGLSYGFFPDGGGGTRAAIMGPVDGDAQYYLAAVLMNRDGSTATESAELRFDTFVRPYQGYANAVQTFTAPTTEEFEQLSPDAAITRELFHVEFSDNGPEQAVHFFEFSIPWEHPDLEDLVTATVTMDLDVLEMNHLMGYESEDGFPGITLAVILDEDGMVDETSTFVAPLTDPGLVTTENVDGSTSVAFDVDIDTTVYSFAGLGISSIWPGNQYTLTWDAPGMLDIIIQ
jgi:hypothetical protein